MTIGASLFVLAVGLILRYAISVSVSGIDLRTVGLILIVVGAIGLAIAIWVTATATRRRALHRPRAAHAEHPALRRRHRLHRQPRGGRGRLRRPLAARPAVAARRPARDG